MNKQYLIWGLEELSDRDFQEHVWLGKSENEMSSFVEAVCHTFDDSGLADSLDSERKSALMEPGVRNSALQLAQLIKKIPQSLPQDEIINHPAMQEVRLKAGEILLILKTSNRLRWLR
jgi:hypothetical protein